jgi:hypothetical protein
VKLREWKNGRYLPLWTCRIRWFGQDHGSSVGLKLELLDCNGSVFLYPETVEKAEWIWSLFKTLAPAQGVNEPVTEKVIKEIEDAENQN